MYKKAQILLLLIKLLITLSNSCLLFWMLQYVWIIPRHFNSWLSTHAFQTPVKYRALVIDMVNITPAFFTPE